MKAIVGIDTEGTSSPALELLSRCRFQALEVTLLHAIPEPSWVVDFPVEAPVWDEDFQSNQALFRAEALARDLGMKAISRRGEGGAGQVLLEVADEEAADLVVVQSQRKGVLRSFFLGSTSRALAIGAKQSLLISKQPHLPQRPLAVVFATDHSKYCDEALNLLLKLKPEGISRVHVLSAVCLDDLQFRTEHLETSQVTGQIERQVQQRLEDLNRGVVLRVAGAGLSVTSSAPIASLAEAASQAMAAHSADLLVMGSQGHGFLERVAIGSRALHQVVSEDHNLLLLRPR